MGMSDTRRHQSDLDRLRSLRPIDDTFMRALFRRQLPLAQEVLRTITGIDDLVLMGEETQFDLKRLVGSRSVELDVWGKDSRGRIYDLEVQRATKGMQPRRARYHSAAMDMEELSSGGDFVELPESYVIFITEEDFFGDGAGVHRFERLELETGLALEDGTHILYANASYKADDALGALMHDFLCSDPNDMKVKSLAERARYFKEDPEGVNHMCKVMDEIREESLLEGRAKGRATAFFDMVGKGLLSRDDAARELDLTQQEFVARAAEMGYKFA